MPHATEPFDTRTQDAQDEDLIRQALDPENTIDFSRELQPGEKADDAVDYGDLSDDELPDEEGGDEAGPDLDQQIISHGFQYAEYRDLKDENAVEVDDYDDLFGEAPTSPVTRANPTSSQGNANISANPETYDTAKSLQTHGHHESLTGSANGLATHNKFQFRAHSAGLSLIEQTMSKDEQMQHYLISMSSHGVDAHQSLSQAGRDDGQSLKQDLKQLWPNFQPDSTPRFVDLLPLKKSYYAGKRPLKQPKPFHLTKVNLEIAPDQEKHFKISAATNRKTQMDDDHAGTIAVSPSFFAEENPVEEVALLSDTEDSPVGGVTWQDLQIVCEDWDERRMTESAESGSSGSCREIHGLDNNHSNISSLSTETGVGWLLRKVSLHPPFGSLGTSNCNNYREGN